MNLYLEIKIFFHIYNSVFGCDTGKKIGSVFYKWMEDETFVLFSNLIILGVHSDFVKIVRINPQKIWETGLLKSSKWTQFKKENRRLDSRYSNDRKSEIWADLMF